MDKIKDDELETYLEKIKTNTSSNSRLRYYKKATSRLDHLKNEYNKICHTLSSDENHDNKHTRKNKKSPITETDSIEKIVTDLENTFDTITKSNGDIQELISRYIQFKNLIGTLEMNTGNFKNEISKVESKRSKIIIEPLNIDDIL